MTAWMTRRILDKDLNVRMPIVIINMIITYITDEQLPARRSIVEEGGMHDTICTAFKFTQGIDG